MISSKERERLAKRPNFPRGVYFRQRSELLSMACVLSKDCHELSCGQWRTEGKRGGLRGVSS